MVDLMRIQDFLKTLAYAIAKFKKYSLDFLVMSTHAPGNSAFNFVERRMAPLSKELAGVVLPHDHYGSHLDAGGKTVDPNLERLNFQHAGETLAEIWSACTIADFPVNAEYVTPPPTKGEEDEELGIDYHWAAQHVRHGQYCLMIAKCGNTNCCHPWLTNWPEVIPGIFVPPPKQVVRGASGPSRISPPSAEPNRSARWMNLTENLALTTLKVPGYEDTAMPFDAFCLSLVKKGTLARRCCSTYFPSIAAKNRHQAVHSAAEEV